MSTDRSKPGAGIWLTMAAVACFAYPASLGPGCWVTSRTGVGTSVVAAVYRPILLVADGLPLWVWKKIQRYSKFGARPGWSWWADKSWHHSSALQSWEILGLSPDMIPEA